MGSFYNKIGQIKSCVACTLQAMLPKGALQAALTGDALKLAASHQDTGHRTSRRAERAAACSIKPEVPSHQQQQEQQHHHHNHQQHRGCLSQESSQGCVTPAYNDEAPSLPHLSPSEAFLHSTGAPSWGLLQVGKHSGFIPLEMRPKANKCACWSLRSFSCSWDGVGFLLAHFKGCWKSL